MYSAAIKQLLTEIEDEAVRPNSRPKPPPRNYMKENFKRLKDIETQVKTKDAEKQPLKPLRATNQYSQIQSKVSNTAKAVCSSQEIGNNRIPPKTALPTRSKIQRSPCLSAQSLGHRSVLPSRSLPQLYPLQRQQTPRYRNSDEDTNTEGSSSRCLSPRKLTNKPEIPHQLGHIPAYLIERKKEWQREKERQIKLLEEANIPPGHTLLPDSERIETLELLQINKEELIQSLAALPVRNDTMRLKKYKEELERQLAKVEEGIKIFSRPKVLIKNDT